MNLHAYMQGKEVFVFTCENVCKTGRQLTRITNHGMDL